MSSWILPTLGVFFCWGCWGFIPKLTIQYLPPSSAILYEVLGSLLLGAIAITVLQIRPEVHPVGIALAIANGFLGFTGAFLFLLAVSRGPVTLIVTVSALYPVFSIFLAALILQEPVSLRQGLGIGLAVIATILIAA
jgi:bacterial/archaeal transporter family protein